MTTGGSLLVRCMYPKIRIPIRHKFDALRYGGIDAPHMLNGPEILECTWETVELTVTLGRLMHPDYIWPSDEAIKEIKEMILNG